MAAELGPRCPARCLAGWARSRVWIHELLNELVNGLEQRSLQLRSVSLPFSPFHRWLSETAACGYARHHASDRRASRPAPALPPFPLPLFITPLCSYVITGLGKEFQGCRLSEQRCAELRSREISGANTCPPGEREGGCWSRLDAGSCQGPGLPRSGQLQGCVGPPPAPLQGKGPQSGPGPLSLALFTPPHTASEHQKAKAPRPAPSLPTIAYFPRDRQEVASHR